MVADVEGPARKVSRLSDYASVADSEVSLAAQTADG